MLVAPGYAEKRSSFKWSILIQKKKYGSGIIKLMPPHELPELELISQSFCLSSTAIATGEPNERQHVRGMVKTEGPFTEEWTSTRHLNAYTHSKNGA